MLKPAIRGGCFGTAPGTQRAAPPVDERSALDPNLDAIKPRAAAVAFGPPPSELSADAHRAPWPVAEAPPAPGPGTYDVPAPGLVFRRSPAVAMAAPTTAERAAAEARKDAANKEWAAKAAAAEAAALAERVADAAAAAARAAELAHRAPFLSSAPREPGNRVTPRTAPAPLGLDALEAVAKVVRRAVPAFSFGAPPPDGARDGARDGTVETPGTALGDAPGTALLGPGAYEPSLELVTKRAPAASFGIGARFVTSSSSDGADCVAGMGEEPPPMTPPRSLGGYYDSSSLSVRGGAIGRAPRFGTGKDAKEGAGAGSSVPFSPTASTVLSDAATDIAPLDEVSRAAAAVRPRAPTALMAPERTAPKHSTKLREEQRQARLGPGRYSPKRSLVERSVSGPSFGPSASAAASPSANGSGAATPTTEQRSRHRRREPPSPGPASYAPRNLLDTAPVCPGAAWSKLSGREPPVTPKTASSPKTTPPATPSIVKAEAEARERSGAEAKAHAEAKAKAEAQAKAEAAAKAKAEAKAKAKAKAEAVEAAAKAKAKAGGGTAGGPGIYEVNYGLVERATIGGSFGKLPSTAPRRRASEAKSTVSRASDVFRQWKARSAELEALLRGEPSAFTFTARPAVPGGGAADAVLRRSSSLVVYKPPANVAPRHPPLREHPAVPTSVARRPPNLEPEPLRFKPRAPSYEFGKLPNRLRSVQHSPSRAPVPVPQDRSMEAARAYLELALHRSAVAIWSHLTAVRFRQAASQKHSAKGSEQHATTTALSLSVRRRNERFEGDVLNLDVLKALLSTRFHKAPVIRWLMPSTAPRKALVPRSRFAPSIMTAPVLLLPEGSHLRRHVPTPLFGPKRHRERSRADEVALADALAFGGMATRDVDWLSLDVLAATYAAVERAVAGAPFGVLSQRRFETVTAAAALLPEGCVLELHPNYDLLHPHHGTLVNMSVGLPTGRGSFRTVALDPDAPGGRFIDLLLPGPGTYDVEPALNLVRPHAMVVDFGAASNPRVRGGAALERSTLAALMPFPATYEAAHAWIVHAITGARRPPAFNFGLSAGRGGGAEDVRGAGSLGEGTLLLLEVGRETGRAMRHDGVGGALSLSRQVGRAELNRPQAGSGACGPLSAGDYVVDERPVRRRWPAVDFGLGPGRSETAADGEGDQLDLQLEMARAAVEPRARVVDFSSAQGHESVAADANPFEGQLLDLHPDPEVILPRHPAAVIHRDPRQRRVRRQPVVRVGDDGILCDIERALAMHEAGDE